MSLIKANFNQKSFYDGRKENPEFLPDKDFNFLTPAEKRNIFDGVMNSLDNAFLRIPADRFLSQEQEMPREAKVELTSKTFKRLAVPVIA